MGKLPAWICNTPKKKRAMEGWVNQQLDMLPLDPTLREPTAPGAIESFKAYLNGDRAVLPQGRRKGRHPLTEFLVRDARREIAAVRAIWQKNYKGKSYRGAMNEPSAAQIVWWRFFRMGFSINPKSLGMKAYPAKITERSDPDMNWD